MPYRCSCCKNKFSEPETIPTTYESYYGVSDLFSNSTPMDLYVCPICNSDDIDETYWDDEDDDLEDEENVN